jgi:hypothetical protein
MQAAVLGSAEQPGISGRLIEVTCATTTCSAELEWKSWDAAREEWRNLMHYPYEPNCAREILLPEPAAADSKAAYRGTMLFNCERARMQASTSEPQDQ